MLECYLIHFPLKQIVDAIMNNKKEEIESLLSKLNIRPSLEDREKGGKALLKAVLRHWLPAGETLLQMIAIHLQVNGNHLPERACPLR